MAQELKGAEAPDTDDYEVGSGSVDDVEFRKEVFDQKAIDPVLAKKMALINSAIDEIGMTPFQWKLFCLNGFGYAVDSVSGQGQQARKLLTFVATHCVPSHRSASGVTTIWPA